MKIKKKNRHSYIDTLRHWCFTTFIIPRNEPTESANDTREYFEKAGKNHPTAKHTLYDYLRGIIITLFKGEKKTQKLSDAMDERMKAALDVLNAEKNKDEQWAIKYGYDYAFIKYALDKLMVHGCEKLSNLTTPKFIIYLSRMGFSNCCSDKTINKYLERTSGDYPRCKFSGVSHLESSRRNAIINKFVELMNTQ